MLLMSWYLGLNIFFRIFGENARSRKCLSGFSCSAIALSLSLLYVRMVKPGSATANGRVGSLRAQSKQTQLGPINEHRKITFTGISLVRNWKCCVNF